jgi:hypothetical protein
VKPRKKRVAKRPQDYDAVFEQAIACVKRGVKPNLHIVTYLKRHGVDLDLVDFDNPDFVSKTMDKLLKTTSSFRGYKKPQDWKKNR